MHSTKKVGRFWTQATESDYDALRRPTAAQNDRTSITNDSRHIDTCQTVQEVLKSCDMYPSGPLDTRDTSTRFASRCSPTRPQRTSRGTLPPSQPGRTIEPPKRGLSAPRSSEVVVTVPLRNRYHDPLPGHEGAIAHGYRHRKRPNRAGRRFKRSNATNVNCAGSEQVLDVRARGDVANRGRRPAEAYLWA